MRGPVTDVVFGILIVEDLIAILLLALLTALVAGSGVSAGAVAIVSLRLAAFLIALIGVGMLESRVVESLVHPVRDVFVAIFFVSVGMLIDPRALAEHWVSVLVLALVVIVGKVLAVSAGAFLSGNGLRTSLQAGMSLAQIGEFSFIIAGVGIAAGAVHSYVYSTAIAVSAVTTLVSPWLIRSARLAALFVDRHLPERLQTFAALYGSWIEHLRERPVDGGRARVRRLVRLMILDAALLGVVIIGFSVAMARFTAALGTLLGWPEAVARFAVIAGGAALSVPLAIGIARVARRLALALAVRALPSAYPVKLDLARAPRTALVVTLQSALLLAVIAPLVAIAAPFLRGVPTVAILLSAVVVLGIALWRAATDLHGHARAAAQAIVAALSQSTADPTTIELTHILDQIKAILPGLGEPTPLVIDGDCSAVGRTLAEMNLRGLTGATVLAIARSSGQEQQILVPTGHERLRAGDVLAIAGPRDSVAAARDLLQAS